MDLSKEFELVESHSFMSEMGVVGGFSPFLRLLGEQPAVQELKAAVSTKEGHDLVVARVEQLFTQHSEAELGDELDVALAVYMDVLYWQDPEAGTKIATRVYQLPNTYWAYGISQAILTREDKTHSQVGE